MADSSVPITAGAGTNIDTRTISGGDHRQVVVVGDPTQTDVATVFGGGYQRVTTEAHQVFYDPFDAAPDTTNSWTTSNAGGGVAPAVASGQLTLGSGTTTAGYSKIISLPTFRLPVPGWLGYSYVVALPDGAAPIANTLRFWGAGTTPGSPTVAAPMTDSIGFEVTTAGKLMAVVYAAGSRTQVADLSSSGTNTQPLDANSHRYGVYYRTDRSYWFIDTLDNVVATASFQSPSVQTLPALLLDVAGTTPGSSAQIQCNGAAVWDTAQNAHQVSDGTFPFRKASVSATGALQVKPATSGTTGLTQPAISASSFTVLAANTNRLGALIYNDSSVVVYVAFAATASTTAYTVQVPPGALYELPSGTIFTGLITGIASTATGNLRVTELSA